VGDGGVQPGMSAFTRLMVIRVTSCVEAQAVYTWHVSDELSAF
jgi:hypothetical protein